MGIISDYKRSLFVNTKPLIGHAKKDLVRHYQIKSKIPFNPKLHWVIYDFRNKKVMKKDLNVPTFAIDFQENTYKNENNEDITFDVEKHIQNNSSDIMIECQLPEEKSILAIFDDTKYTPEDEDYIWYNLFHTHIRGKIYEKTKEEIDNLRYKLIPEMHWIWFRKPETYLSERIVRRSSSWLDLNPEIKFHLWTDLINEDEAIDFFSKSDPTGDYRKRIIIHYKEETWNIAKEFCEENFQILKGENLWDVYKGILDNKVDKSAMIFKTDILRCMILHQRGGWYSDYNDTFCFIPLKYVINQEKRDLIYLGCDIYSNQNNYIMYSPQYNTKWLELTSEIVRGGINTYKMLVFDDKEFLDNIRIILNSFVKSCLETVKDNFLEDCVSKLNIWLRIYDTKIDEFISRYNLNLKHSFHFTANELLLLIRYMFSNHNPNSSVAKRISYEIDNAQSLNKNRMNKFVLRWKPQTWDKTYLWNECLTELQELQDIPFSNKTIMNTVLFTNMKKLLYTTNMGAYFHGKKELEKYIYSIPHCYVMGCFSFLTALGHIGDGTSAGGDIYDYNPEAI